MRIGVPKEVKNHEYRVAITPILVAGALGNLETDIPQALLAGLAVVLAGDLVLLVGVILGRFRGLLRSTAFLAIDLAVAVGLNLWATSTLPHGTFLWTGRDIVWGYGLGVISFWTALRGARTGGAILAGGIGLHVLMARLNGAVFDFDGWMTFLARIAWLALAFGLALVLVALARQGARAAVGEGLRAGREAERARLLRETHDTALQTLEAIALRSGAEDGLAAERLREIRASALQQATELRAVLREDTVRQGGLTGGLRALTEEFLRRGLHIELVIDRAHPVGRRGDLAGDGLSVASDHPGVDARPVGVNTDRVGTVPAHPEDVLAGALGLVLHGDHAEDRIALISERPCSADHRDHNLNLSSAFSQLLEPKGPRPAVPPNRGRPLVTAHARARPL